jgi:tetratricopeptide (TPR) repeat protein
VIGGGLTRLGVGDIATFDSQGIPTGSATFSDMELGVGYGLRLQWPFRGAPADSLTWAAIRSGLDVGLVLRYRRQSLAETSGAGIGLDLGVALEPRPGLAFGMRARNLLAPSLTLYETAERLPRSLVIGAAYARPLAGRVLLLTGEGTVGASETPYAFGGELPISGGLRARAGLAGSKVRVGGGFAAGFLSVDYGLETHDLGLAHLVSVTARLGEGATARRRNELAARELERAEIARTAAAEALAKSAVELRTRARGAPSRSDARSAWLGLLAQKPGDPEATAALVELDRQEAAARTDSLRTAAERHRAEIEREQRAAEAGESAGDLAGAALHWSLVIALFPEDPAARAGLTRVRDRLQVESDSLASTRQTLEDRETELTRHRAEVVRLTSLVRALEAQAVGDLSRARAIADSLLKAHPRDPAALAVRSQAGQPTALDDPKLRDEARRLYIEGTRRFNNGDYAGAVRFWEELMALDPTNPAVRMNLEEARARQGAAR